LSFKLWIISERVDLNEGFQGVKDSSEMLVGQESRALGVKGSSDGVGSIEKQFKEDAKKLSRVRRLEKKRISFIRISIK